MNMLSVLNSATAMASYSDYALCAVSTTHAYYCAMYGCKTVHGLVWQDEHQQARCWFGAAVSQKMQGEHDAALQSLDIAENMSSETLVPSKARSERQESSSDSSTSDEDTSFIGRTAKCGSQSAEMNSAVKTLLSKTLLAKASILTQLERKHEANECMKSARALDSAIGKYIKD